MKKLIALLLALVMVLSLAACGEKKPSKDEPIVVTYYCSIGAYLAKLQEEINKWNEGAGKEAGVYIQLESNINSYTNDLEALMNAGTHYDLIDAGTGNDHWKAQGWVKDLNSIDNAELKKIIEGYKQYFVDGLNTDPGPDGNMILTAMPLEVVPLKLAVNTDLFAAKNIAIPTTWDELVDAAIALTDPAAGVYGYGGTTWSAYYTRLHMMTSANSLPHYWDPATETYSFTQYEPIIMGLKEMFEAGAIMGLDDLAIDPIRAEFANGKVAMFPAPAYDFAVYTTQFPAQCNWTVIDFPVVDPTTSLKGAYMDRVGCAIDAVSYDKADKAKQAAIVKAFCFLNSDELNASIYAMGGMIPYKAEVIANTKVEVEQPQWALFADIADYCSHPQFPDSVIPLEGDKIHDVMNAIVHGALEWDAAVADLEARYNAAWQAAKADPDINTSLYSYNYSNAK